MRLTRRSSIGPMGRAARRPLTRTFRSLRNPNYRLYWIGQVVSMLGTWMQTIAQAWLVLRLTDSPFALGVVTACQTLPVLVFALFGGVIADRVPKWRLLVITQTVMLVQTSAVAFLTAGGWINLTALYLLAGVLGTATALDNPTRQAFVKEMVGPEDVPNAVALNSIVQNTARLAGPALAGLTIAAVGVTACFALNAVSFLAVIGALLLMRSERFYASQRMLLTGAAGFSALLLCLALSTRWLTMVPALAVLGACSITYFTTSTSRVQLIAPPELRGRVMSLYALLDLGSAPIGSLLLGTLAKHLGVRPAVGAFAVACGLGTFVGFLTLRQRHGQTAQSLPQEAIPPA
ncbi:MAG: MFS transporter [Thermomicrobia bacterium]|nr:MFS transporter [Thermomicrobia bacterium]